MKEINLGMIFFFWGKVNNIEGSGKSGMQCIVFFLINSKKYGMKYDFDILGNEGQNYWCMKYYGVKECFEDFLD